MDDLHDTADILAQIVTSTPKPVFLLAILTVLVISFALHSSYAPKKGTYTFASIANLAVQSVMPSGASTSESVEIFSAVTPASRDPDADEDIESNGPITPIPESNHPHIEIAQVRTSSEDDRETLEWERRAEAELEYRCDRTGRVPRPDWLGPEPYNITPDNMPDMSYYPQPPRAFRRPASPPSVVVGNLNRPGRGAYRGSGRPKTRALPSPLASPSTSNFATNEEKQVDGEHRSSKPSADTASLERPSGSDHTSLLFNTGNLASFADNPHESKQEPSSTDSDPLECETVSFGHNKGLYEDRQKQEKRKRDAEIALRVEQRRRERKAQEAEARKTDTSVRMASMQMIPSTSYKDDPMLADIESTPALWETVDFDQLNKEVLANLGPTTTYLPSAGC
ncbi:hypothetical protein CYLTODRAFT_488483 [Cylindrobasidium torrendii FP15055 ss-10]|uniref:Uncharacterized protein n=1 Tax=Cylindrobasidium torrendii FP15055 ss-10 TaxID=1314674 RepID=A0A0D7BIE3_9AGAR|nr:hypothetical protein CYLTODRAFT_488483 [Cylindrobasidium torrendii FP15055 ss-10]